MVTSPRLVVSLSRRSHTTKSACCFTLPTMSLGAAETLPEGL